MITSRSKCRPRNNSSTLPSSLTVGPQLSKGHCNRRGPAICTRALHRTECEVHPPQLRQLRLTHSQAATQTGEAARTVPRATRKNLERNEMNRSVANLIAVAERSEKGFTDVPPGSVNDEIEMELAGFGYAVALSDRLWIGGYRIHTPESVQAG